MSAKCQKRTYIVEGPISAIDPIRAFAISPPRLQMVGHVRIEVRIKITAIFEPVALLALG